MAEIVWLIPAFPLFGFAVLLLFGRRLGDPRSGYFATAMTYFAAPYDTSSNAVTLSALVQSPIWPASEKVLSSTSKAGLPLKITLKWLPADSTRRACHWPEGTGILIPYPPLRPTISRALRVPFTVL